MGKNIAEQALHNQAVASRGKERLGQLAKHVGVKMNGPLQPWMTNCLTEIMSDPQLIKVFDRCKAAKVLLVISDDKTLDLSADGTSVFIGLKATFEDIRKFLLGQ